MNQFKKAKNIALGYDDSINCELTSIETWEIKNKMKPSIIELNEESYCKLRDKIFDNLCNKYIEWDVEQDDVKRKINNLLEGIYSTVFAEEITEHVTWCEFCELLKSKCSQYNMLSEYDIFTQEVLGLWESDDMSYDMLEKVLRSIAYQYASLAAKIVYQRNKIIMLNYLEYKDKYIIDSMNQASVSKQYFVYEDGYNVDIAHKIWDLVNKERKDNDLTPLLWDMNIYDFACIRAKEIVIDFSHDRNPGIYAENILHTGKFYEDMAEAMHNLWANSIGHHNNYMNSDFTKGACSVYYKNNHWYAVENFDDTSSVEDVRNGIK